ncbi:hypothetical protein [Streptomyces chartreusis]|uniref:hypothetical protein n=1 Tax=Streptomyces chartreusis TaxID=1969 RepID=UPI003814825B
MTNDLKHNVKEQERISAEIVTLQEELAAMQHDHAVLVNVQQALGVPTPAEPDTEAQSAALPSPRQSTSTTHERNQTAVKPAAKRETAAPKRPAAKSADSPKATQPTLVALIRRCLLELKEPRSAAEITAALGQAHPERQFATKVVRITLEGLVAKSQAERTKQGKSVFYAAHTPKSPATSEAGAQPSEAGH